ncbi:hypothetical protein AALA98_16640 [Lachnospiraceae bacterium 45-W7]
MIAFYISRHEESLLNSLNRAQGWSDSPLTDNVAKAAWELVIKLKGFGNILIVSHAPAIKTLFYLFAPERFVLWIN